MEAGSFETVPVPGKGLGVVSRVDIEPETLLWDEAAAVAVVTQEHLKECCSSCFQRPGKFGPTRCLGCRTVIYCSERCQRKDWELHRIECSLWQMLAEQVPFTMMRMIARLLIKIAQEPSFLNRFPSWRSIELKGIDSALLEHFQSWISMLFSLIPFALPKNLPLDDCVKLAFMLKTHSFTPEDSFGFAPGLFFFPRTGHLNHSCSPNVEYCRTGRTLRILSTDRICSGEELTISYIDRFLPKAERRELLRTQFFFDCRCLRCSNGKNAVSSEQMAAILDKSVDISVRMQLLSQAQSCERATGEFASLHCLLQMLPAIEQACDSPAVAAAALNLLLDDSDDLRLRAQIPDISVRKTLLEYAQGLCVRLDRHQEALVLGQQAVALQNILDQRTKKQADKEDVK